jgi:hypothetical protein
VLLFAGCVVVFPNGTAGPMFYEYGFCSVPLLDSSLVATCNAQQLTFEEVMEINIPSTPNVPYSFIQVIMHMSLDLEYDVSYEMMYRIISTI